jgi:hypothetical protein
MRIIGKTKDYYDYACTKDDGLILERPVLDAAIRKRSEFIDFLKAGQDFSENKYYRPITKLPFILTVGYSHYLCSYSILDDAFALEHEYWDEMITPTMSEDAKLSSKGFDSSSFRGKYTGRKFKKGGK